MHQTFRGQRYASLRASITPPANSQGALPGSLRRQPDPARQQNSKTQGTGLRGLSLAYQLSCSARDGRKNRELNDILDEGTHVYRKINQFFFAQNIAVCKNISKWNIIFCIRYGFGNGRVNIIVLSAFYLDRYRMQVLLNKKIQLSVFVAVIEEHGKSVCIQLLCNCVFINAAQIDRLVSGQDFDTYGVPVLAGQKADVGGIQFQKAAFHVLAQGHTRLCRVIDRNGDTGRTQP